MDQNHKNIIVHIITKKVSIKIVQIFTYEFL